jgi:hypothetical protein
MRTNILLSKALNRNRMVRVWSVGEVIDWKGYIEWNNQNPIQFPYRVQGTDFVQPGLLPIAIGRVPDARDK